MSLSTKNVAMRRSLMQIHTMIEEVLKRMATLEEKYEAAAEFELASESDEESSDESDEEFVIGSPQSAPW